MDLSIPAIGGGGLRVDFVFRPGFRALSVDGPVGSLCGGISYSRAVIRADGRVLDDAQNRVGCALPGSGYPFEGLIPPCGGISDLVAVRQPAQAEGGVVEAGFSQKAIALSPAQGEYDIFEVRFGQDAVFDDAGHPSVCCENQQVHGFPFLFTLLCSARAGVGRAMT